MSPSYLAPTPPDQPLTFGDKLRKSARDLAIAVVPIIAASIAAFVQSNPLEGTKYAALGTAIGTLYMVVADAVRRQWFPPAPPPVNPSPFV